MSERMKGFTCCGDCIHYNYKKHKCNLGASIETDARNPFYDDCPIPDVPSEQEIRDKALDEFTEALNNKISEFVLQHKDNLDFASGISVAWNIVNDVKEQRKEVGE